MERTTKITIKTIIIIFFILLFLYLNELYIDEIYSVKQNFRKELEYSGFKDNLSEKQLNYAFFGSSHTRDAIMPTVIDNSFNFASGGENYFLTYYKVKRLIDEDNFKVKYVILEFDRHQFSSGFINEEKVLLNYRIYSPIIPLKEILRNTDFSNIRLILDNFFPLIGSGKDFFIRKSSNEVSRIEMGWVENNENYNNIRNKERHLRETYEELFTDKKEISEVSFSYFLETLEFLDENNVKVILISYPVTSDYNSYVFNRSNVSRSNYNREIIEKLDENYEKMEEIIFLDLDEFYLNKDEFFADSNHLNSDGALDFSLRLNRTLNNLDR